MTYQQLLWLLQNKLTEKQLEQAVKVRDKDGGPYDPAHLDLDLGSVVVQITETHYCDFCGAIVIPSNSYYVDDNGWTKPHFSDHCRKAECCQASSKRHVDDLMKRAAEGDECAQDRLDDWTSDAEINY